MLLDCQEVSQHLDLQIQLGQELCHQVAHMPEFHQAQQAENLQLVYLSLQLLLLHVLEYHLQHLLEFQGLDFLNLPYGCKVQGVELTE